MILTLRCGNKYILIWDSLLTVGSIKDVIKMEQNLGRGIAFGSPGHFICVTF